MSNARSPREVCSTTIGTSGLTVLASFRFGRSSPAQLLGWEPGRQPSNRQTPRNPVYRLGTRSPDLTAGAALGALGVARSPELLARLRLLDGDRLGRGGDELPRLALGEVLLERLEPAGRLEALQQLLRRGPARPVTGRLLDGLAHLVVARLDPLRLDDRRQHGLAPQRLLGVGLALLDDLLLLATGDPQVGLAVDALVRERMQHRVPQLAGARLHQRLGDVDRGGIDRRVERSLAELGLDLGCVGL